MDYTTILEALLCTDYYFIPDEPIVCFTRMEECDYVDYHAHCMKERINQDAATAIEELMAQVKDKDYLIQQQTEEIQRLQRDVKKQQKKMIELAKGLPKRGEWKINEKCGYKYQCSICGMFSGLDKVDVESGWTLNNYCSNCGAKMEVQE